MLAVSYFASAAVQAGFAYLAVWFLLFGGMRPVLELPRRRGSIRGSSRPRASRAGPSDADQLARLTGVASGVWVALFVLVSAAALAVGARLLIPVG